jgi:hypothetical protein
VDLGAVRVVRGVVVAAEQHLPVGSRRREQAAGLGHDSDAAREDLRLERLLRDLKAIHLEPDEAAGGRVELGDEGSSSLECLGREAHLRVADAANVGQAPVTNRRPLSCTSASMAAGPLSETI